MMMPLTVHQKSFKTAVFNQLSLGTYFCVFNTLGKHLRKALPTVLFVSIYENMHSL